jgi:hypothetical protein
MAWKWGTRPMPVISRDVSRKQSTHFFTAEDAEERRGTRVVVFPLRPSAPSAVRNALCCKYRARNLLRCWRLLSHSRERVHATTGRSHRVARRPQGTARRLDRILRATFFPAEHAFSIGRGCMRPHAAWKVSDDDLYSSFLSISRGATTCIRRFCRFREARRHGSRRFYRFREARRLVFVVSIDFERRDDLYSSFLSISRGATTCIRVFCRSHAMRALRFHQDFNDPMKATPEGGVQRF